MFTQRDGFHCSPGMKTWILHNWGWPSFRTVRCGYQLSSCHVLVWFLFAGLLYICHYKWLLRFQSELMVVYADDSSVSGVKLIIVLTCLPLTGSGLTIRDVEGFSIPTPSTPTRTQSKETTMRGLLANCSSKLIHTCTLLFCTRMLYRRTQRLSRGTPVPTQKGGGFLAANTIITFNSKAITNYWLVKIKDFMFSDSAHASVLVQSSWLLTNANNNLQIAFLTRPKNLWPRWTDSLILDLMKLHYNGMMSADIWV
jgi:hypothetical protein